VRLARRARRNRRCRVRQGFEGGSTPEQQLEDNVARGGQCAGVRRRRGALWSPVVRECPTAQGHSEEVMVATIRGGERIRKGLTGEGRTTASPANFQRRGLLRLSMMWIIIIGTTRGSFHPVWSGAGGVAHGGDRGGGVGGFMPM
jgi:hypothetical protein